MQLAWMRAMQSGEILLGSIPPDLNIPYLPFSLPPCIWNVLPGLIEDRVLTRRDGKQFSSYIAPTSKMAPGHAPKH